MLDLLEYFATIRRAATVSEVEHALDIPQSSASVLMRSLVELGYLEYLPGERRFRPTLRVAKLGDWVEHGLPGPLTAELETLHNQLHETIILGRQQGAQVEFIYILIPDRSVQFYARRNSLQSMTISSVGRALLAQLPESVARGIIRRSNAEAPAALLVKEADLLVSLEKDREQGFTETNPAFGGERDFHVIAKVLPRVSGTEQLAVGVAGPRLRMMANRELVMDTLDEWVARVATVKTG